jgi:hypothetical protein
MHQRYLLFVRDYPPKKRLWQGKSGLELKAD